jgi:hypothetical protein
MRVLQEVNERIAGIFKKPVQPVRFVFLSYVSGRYKNGECVGLCVQAKDYCEIQILLRPKWQNTAIHELVHAYNPGMSELMVRRTTADVIKLLKLELLK